MEDPDDVLIELPTESRGRGMRLAVILMFIGAVVTLIIKNLACT